MKKELLIIGASGHGKVVADIALRLNKWENISFLDDNTSLKTVMGLPVIGRSRDAYKYIDKFEIVVAIGNNHIRKKIQDGLTIKGGVLATLVHPSAIISAGVDIGVGSVIMAGVVVNPCTEIGQGCIVNTSSSLDHDNDLDDYVHISPGVHLSGNVKVGNCTWIGVGATVSNNISICDDCVIGAGGVVVKDIKTSGTYMGVPVRKT